MAEDTKSLHLSYPALKQTAEARESNYLESVLFSRLDLFRHNFIIWSSMSSPPSPPKPLAHLYASLPSYLSKTNAQVAHINRSTPAALPHRRPVLIRSRLLSQTSTLDKTLLTVSYTLHLLHSILSKTPRLTVSRLATSLTPLTAIFDDVRVFLRLWGLLGIYSWGVSTYLTPPGDRIVGAITWGQVVACALFQGLENGAYLAEKGVLGWKKERVARAWIWSGRAWCAYVALELARLGYEWGELKGQDLGRQRRSGGLRGTDAEGETVEKGELELRMDKVEDDGLKERWGKWYREVGVNVAYAPMTIHYSLENGFLSEGAIGGLGVVVGALSFEQAWRETA